MAIEKRRIDVMVSSTTNDLGEHRRSLAGVINTQLMTPRMMDNDVATGKDGLTYSLDLVDEAEIYILLLGFRYGYVPEDPVRNPDKLGMTHLEYRRAKQRASLGECCVFAFLLDDSLKPEIVRPELAEFRKEVLGDQVKFFKTIEGLKLEVSQTLSIAECVQSLKEQGGKQLKFSPRVGEELDGRYTFEQKLGEGGNGEVWKAQERLPDDTTFPVAIKLLKPEISDKPQRIERFKNEISLTRRLRHPNIIMTNTDGNVGEQYYAVMDYIEGQTLREFIKGKPFSIDDTIRYLGQVGEALTAAHSQQKIIHRDVKPENIMVKGEHLYLGDFGLAISPEEDMSVTESGEWVGTKKYMAPEQWNQEDATPQTDIYALAIIAYEMLTGNYPYDESSPGYLMNQHINESLPDHPDIPVEIMRILHRASDKVASARHESADEFIAALSTWELDPDNLDTKVRQHLDTLRKKLKGDLYETLFVDMEGNVRAVMAQIQEQTEDDEVYEDLNFAEFEEFANQLSLERDADHHEVDSKEATYVPDIIEQLLNSERVVLVGEPGAGKSFTLRRLVMRYIRDYDEYQRVPVFVPLNAFKGETSFADFIKKQMGSLKPYYEVLRDSKQLVLICDALNEMPRTADDGERNLVNEVRDELAKVPQFVVSCRIRDYRNDLDSLKLERLEVRDLDLPAIREFVKRYRLLLKYDDEELWQKMGGSDLLLEFWKIVRDANESERFWQENISSPGYSEDITDWDLYYRGRQAWRQMWSGAKLIPLSRNPYLARVICGLHGRDQMPSNRGELYGAFVDDLYQREQNHATARGQKYPERGKLETFLSELANRMQSESATTVKVESITDENLLQASLDATILTQDGDDLRFSHQLLQEYFAARILFESMMNNADSVPIFGDTWWNVTVWREAVDMLITFSKDPLRVMRWIAPASLPIVEELAETNEIAISDLGEDFLMTLAKGWKNSKNPIRRAAAYRVLGMYDADTRPFIGVKNGLPDIDWVTIPAGIFQMGSEDDEENPLREINIDYDFKIARYPATYAQFQSFVDADDGWQDDRWWQGLPEEGEHNGTTYVTRELSEQAFKYTNHPREMVSWYQAIAFCRWFSWKLGGGYALDDIGSWKVRLPTEFEWEKAARGNTGWQYPWGNEPDTNKGNSSNTGIGKSSAVGIFFAGDTPHWEKPISDMSGNVWERCITGFDDFLDLEITKSSVRGCSWMGSSDTIEGCTYIEPRHILDDNTGFRLVAPVE